jgi:hypothetical protein
MSLRTNLVPLEVIARIRSSRTMFMSEPNFNGSILESLDEILPLLREKSKQNLRKDYRVNFQGISGEVGSLDIELRELFGSSAALLTILRIWSLCRKGGLPLDFLPKNVDFVRSVSSIRQELERQP